MKQISSTQSSLIARTRFDKPQPQSPEKAEIEVAISQVGHHNLKNVRYIDTSLPEEQAIRNLQLPAHTLYLIDKVVRQKAMTGPIGVDNSEYINIEQERELRRRNRKLLQGQDADQSDNENDEKMNEKLL